MAAESVLKSLSRDTKALIIVNEFEARRLTIDQMRSVLSELVVNADEQNAILTIVENDLRATGYHPNMIQSFLVDLTSTDGRAGEQPLRQTRRLRSGSSMSFEDHSGGGAVQVPGAGASPSPESAAPMGAEPAFRGTVQVADPFYKSARGRTAVFSSPGQGAPPSPSAVPQPPAMPSPPLRAQGSGLFPPPTSQNAPPMGKRVGTMIVPSDVPRPTVPGFGSPQAPAPAFGAPSGNTAAYGADSRRLPSSRTQVGLASGARGGTTVGGKPRVLLADDDMRIRIVFRLCLERLGLAVVEAQDGNEAWRLLQEGGFSLAVLDMKMPGLHGLEVLSRVSDHQLSLPIIICSAYDQLKDEFVVATHPHLRYLVKPVASEALEKAARELLNMPAK